jgi:hypothetical protein
MTDEEIQERLKHALNCLGRFDELEISASDHLRDEVDFLRRAVLTSRSEILDTKQSLQDARRIFPSRLLGAILKLYNMNSVSPLQNYPNS